MAVATMLAGAVHAQMALPGEFAVSPVGTATYTVPIKLPPGVAGLQPSLSFNYDSANGPGLLGVGWQLSGLSAITRCPRTMAQDGVRGAIKFADTDRFCLDGARLMAVSGDAASYTSAGMEYRTEIESFSKIVSSAETGATAGPGSFTVRTKGGLTMEYGKTADSRIEAQGSTAVAVWALNKVTDVAGNHYTVAYIENNTNGEFYPTSISYTGNTAAGLAPAFKVGFVYETRPDIAPAYLGGKLSKKTVRMKTLQIYSAGAVVNQYNISYAATSATRKRSAITSISYCDAAGVCIPSTAFTTSVGNAAFTFWSQSITPGRVDDNAHYFYDVNGDGRPDWIRVSRASNAIWVALAKLDGTFDFWTKQFGTIGPLQFYQHHFVDINGDGKVDWVQISRDSNNSWVGLSNGDGTFNTWSKQSTMTGSLNVFEHYLVDVNGDGLPDWIQIERAGNAAWTALGRGDGSFDFWTKSFAAGSVEGSQHYFADINGDGMADWIRVSRGSNNAYIALAKGDGSFDMWTSQSSVPGAWNNYWHDFADVNGDGKPDWIQVDRFTNNAWIGFSKGDGTFEFWSKVITVGNNNTFGHFLVDVNGDGRADWIQINRNENTGGVALSNGDGSFNFWNFYTTIGQLGHFEHYFADINGDGRPDWIQVTRASVHTGQIALSSAAPDGLLTGMATATAANLSIDYTTAAASLGDRYSRSSEASYPRLSVPSSWPLVKSATRYTTVSGSTVQRDLHITNYWYDSATYELGTGRGFLGYAYTQEQDATTGLVNRTTWKLGFPLQGKPGLRTRGTAPTSHDDLGRVTYDYGCVDTGTGTYLDTCATETGHRYFVYPRLVQSSGNRDLTATGVPGAGLPGSAVSQTVDVWGNPLTVTAQTLKADGSPSGHSKSTTHQYAPADTSNWLLGRVLRSTVTSVSP